MIEKEKVRIIRK